MRKLITALLLSISIQTFSQQLIFATITGGDLYSFDVTNCTRHFIGSTGQGFGDIAFTPNGKLWGIIGGKLYQIDTASANATLIGNTGVGSVALVGLNDTTLLAEFGMKLYGIRTTNATSYYIDTIGFHASGDLTWYDDDLYMVTTGSQIVKMVFNSSNTAFTSVTTLGNTIPNCAGAVTMSFVGENNSIVGFNNANLIKICHIDGSSQMLCPNLNIGGTPGAASLRLATQTPQPTACSVPSSVQEKLVSNQFVIFPNPTSYKFNIQSKLNMPFHFNIYNSIGQLVKSGISQWEITSIIMDNFCNGLYNIELITHDTIERQNFIIEK